MSTKENVISVPEGYKILRTNKDGTEKTVASLHGVSRTDSTKAVGMLLGMVAKEADKQGAALSLLCYVLDGSLADLQEFCGTGDKKKGQLSEGVKDAFRKAEDSYFDAMMKPDHANHKAYLKGLPSVNIDGDKLPEAPGERHAYFKTRLRKDPSYANAKNLALNLWHFVGLHLYDEKAGTIRPPQVMRVLINNAKEVDNTAPTYAQKLSGMLREIFMPADPKKPPAIADKEWPTLIQDLERALEEAKQKANTAAARATAQASTAGGVKQQADAAVKDAKKETETAPV